MTFFTSYGVKCNIKHGGVVINGWKVRFTVPLDYCGKHIAQTLYISDVARKKRSAGFEFNRLRTDYNANRSQKDMCMKPCAKRDLYADVKVSNFAISTNF